MLHEAERGQGLCLSCSLFSVQCLAGDSPEQLIIEKNEARRDGRRNKQGKSEPPFLPTTLNLAGNPSRTLPGGQDS